MERVTLDLGASSAAKDLPTDERIVTQGAKDPHLVSLLFAYGRYLLAGSSRPGTQPANLQGIWNDQVRPPWSSNYTLNINAQMNYWHAESANLADMHGPLLDMIGDLAVTGAKTARTNYGAPRLVRAPQLGPVASVRPRRRLRRRRSRLGVVADGGPVARAAPVVALRVRRRSRVPGVARVSGDEKRRRVLPRLARRQRERPARHGAVHVARAQVRAPRRQAGGGEPGVLDGPGAHLGSVHQPARRRSTS